MSGIKCGRCQCYHATVADVRECSMGGRVAVLDPPPTATKYVGPSPKQRTFINRMRTELGMVEYPDEYFNALDSGTTRRTIDDLIAQTNAAKVKKYLQQSDHPTVTAGYYAVPSLTGNNDLDFFRVDAPTEGKWDGYLFVKRGIGGGTDGPRFERVALATAEHWLALILPPFAARAAQERYGKEIGRCGKCGRALTDETSRQRGIGPDCWSRM